MQEQGGINLYAYVNGDPLGYVDPDGRHPALAGAEAGFVIAGPLGAAVGAAVGASAGVAICTFTDLCNFSESGESDSDDQGPKQAENKVKKGQGPCEIDRIDRPHGQPDSQWHAHGKKGGALNQDGTLKDSDPKFSNKTKKWLKKHGWKI